MRKMYMGRFVLRCLTLAAVTLLMLVAPEQFEILEENQFFTRFSLLHLLWFVWLCDMLTQLLPLRKPIVALGSQKSFGLHFRSALNPPSPRQIREKAIAATKRAYIVFGIWAVLILALGGLHAKKILSDLALLWISVFFYVCDLICVLFWCPFRHFIMKNRCCTTCRIFNWDHLMMFSPLIFVKGFYAQSLVVLAILVFVCWEFTAFRHPERFVESANQTLKCSACTDRLCLHAKKIHGSKPVK